MSRNVFSVDGTRVTLNDREFKVIGLRVSNAIITDKTTRQLIDNLDVYRSYGVNTVSVFFMGSRFGDCKGYLRDASIDPAHAARMGRVIAEADARDMVVIVGCLYWSNSRAKEDLVATWTEEHADRAVANTVRWLRDHEYRNVFVDVDNEGMAYRATGWSIASMIDAAHDVDPSIMTAYNDRDDPPAQADLYVHHSPKVDGRPWIQSEGTPNNARGGYWGAFSKEDGYYNYLRIGRYTDDMKREQIETTDRDIAEYNGHVLASTWLQCPPHEGIGGPFMTPGGRADGPTVDEDVKALRGDEGVLWWLEHVRDRYGAWTGRQLVADR